MNKIHRYMIFGGAKDVSLMMRLNAQPLDIIFEENNTVNIMVLENEEAELVNKRLYIRGPDESVPEYAEYVGRYQDGDHYWFVFEDTRDYRTKSMLAPVN